jgi:hypothetical protein
MNFIKLDKAAEFKAAGRTGTLTIAPADMERVFGKATWAIHSREGGDGKVDREWQFRAEDGQVYRVYAYKATSLYDSTYPAPTEFWSRETLAELSIARGEDTQSFKEWVYARVHNRHKVQPRQGDSPW